MGWGNHGVGVGQGGKGWWYRVGGSCSSGWQRGRTGQDTMGVGQSRRVWFGLGWFRQGRVSKGGGEWCHQGR